MCGIAGFFGASASEENLRKVLKPIEHRGEKDYLYETKCLDGVMSIGMHRLAIVDEHYGNQPLVSEDQSVYCIFNGEIYNHQRLREQLASSFEFSSECDSEVVLKAYLKWGKEFVEKLDGKFAIAIIDLNKDVFYLARDPMGIKPLYYLQLDDDSWAFSSEIKSLSQLKHLAGNSSILSISPGSYWINGEETIYFKLKPFKKNKTEDFQRLPEIKNSLEKAVRKRIPSSAPKIACLLSGGIDSAIITYLASKVHKNVVAYTLNITGEESADFNAARLLCDNLGIQHVVVTPSIKEMQQLYLSQGVFMLESFEPILVRNAVSYYFVCKKIVQDGFKYAFTGEGADELFGGYDFIRQAREESKDKVIFQSLQIIHETYLQMADRASMYTTLEVRVPFMDKEFVKLCLSLPPNYRLFEGENKVALRKLYEDMLPKEICYRKKEGMNQGAGFGKNKSNDSIYFRCVKEFYESSPDQYEKDFSLAKKLCHEFQLDISNCEEVYNFSRYLQARYDMYSSRKRLQLNGDLLPSLSTSFGCAQSEKILVGM